MAYSLNASFGKIKPFVCINAIENSVNFLFMSESVFSRIENELEAQQKKVEWFCLAIGVRHESYSQNWTNWGKRGFPKGKIAIAARVLGVSMEWLATGEGPKYNNIVLDVPKGLSLVSPNATLGHVTTIEANGTMHGGFDLWDSKTPLSDDDVELPFFREVELAAGSGRTEVVENHGPKLRFAKSTLKRKSVQAENAYCVMVSGNSMEPVLPDGSAVGVDVSNRTIKNGDMYAIDHHGSLRVKRLYTLPGGGIRLKSWNDDEYPDENYTAEEAASIKIIGRVFWTSALW